MPKQNLIIGGNHIPDEEVEAQVERLRSNRTILVAPVNDDADDEPELMQCETINDVFKTYKPNAEISVKDAEGGTDDCKISFKNIKSFDLDQVVDAAPKLKEQKDSLAVMKDLKNQLRENVKLRRAVEDGEQRKKLIASLQEALKALQSGA